MKIAILVRSKQLMYVHLLGENKCFEVKNEVKQSFKDNKIKMSEYFIYEIGGACFRNKDVKNPYLFQQWNKRGYKFIQSLKE